MPAFFLHSAVFSTSCFNLETCEVPADGQREHRSVRKAFMKITNWGFCTNRNINDDEEFVFVCFQLLWSGLNRAKTNSHWSFILSYHCLICVRNSWSPEPMTVLEINDQKKTKACTEWGGKRRGMSERLWMLGCLVIDL